MPEYVGRALGRREDARFLTGRATYLDDVDPPGALHAAFVRSFHAHAELVHIDVSSVPAGVTVLAAADIADLAGSLPPGSIEDGVVADAGHPVLARERVRYVGEAVAIVLADSRAEAEDAADLVGVEYAPLDPVLDARTAAAGVVLHEHVPGNALVRWSRRSGDPDAAFAQASHVVSGRFRMPRLVAAPIEPRGAIAEYDGRADLLTVRTSSQDPHRPLAQLGHALGRDRERIRVLVPDVGGAFGSKGAVAPEVAAVAAAAIRLGRPVKWAEDRFENFLAAYQGRGLEADAELALAGDGTMLALRARLYADLGAYLYPTTAVAPHTAAMLLTGTYRIPAVDVELVGAATNKVPTGPYRGAGRPEAAYVVERLVDMAARDTGIDRIELRRTNFVPRDAFPYETPLGWTYDSGDYERCLDTALRLAEVDRWRDEQRSRRGSAVALGIGVGMYVERSGGLWESAEIERAGERLVVYTGSSPHGQGHETTFAQIVADELGVDPSAVDVRWGDSSELTGVGTFASRSVAMGGSAVLAAARRLKEEGGAKAEARFESPLVFASGAYVAVVEVERATGAARVVALAAVDDSGRIVNPLLAEGQVLGATVQGLGECLSEEAVYDETGQPRTVSFADYSLLTAAEVPPIASAFVETPSPLNPLGAKGIGEGGAIATPAAVANAVADAIGLDLDPPFTEQKLWRALQPRTDAT